MKHLPLVAVDRDNVDDTSFFCMQSKPKSPGYQRKRQWLDKRLREGLRIRMLGQRDRKKWTGERGFIEYIPGEYAWRGIEAADYMVIHCLWVVGRSRGNGGASRLLAQCLADAKAEGFAGVATVTAENGFATSRKFYEHHDFEEGATLDPRVSLMVKRFGSKGRGRAKKHALPEFSSGALRGPAHYRKGLTIVRTDQCPYIDDATALIESQAKKRKIDPIKIVELKSADAVRRRSPSPYGVFSVVLDGTLVSYRYQTAAELDKAIARIRPT